MKKSIFIRTSLMVALGSVATVGRATLVGLWNINGTYASAIGGSALTPFGTQSWVTAMVAGTSRQVLELTPGTGPANDYRLEVQNPIGANGVGARTNSYTIVLDIKVDPTVGNAGFQSLLQSGSSDELSFATNSGPTENDGEWFLKNLGANKGGLGVFGDYEDFFFPTRFEYSDWHCVALSLNTGGEYTSYVDGEIQNQVQVPEGQVFTDGRFSLNTTQFWLFGDNDHEIQKTYLGSVQIHNRALSAAEVKALGSLQRFVSGKVSTGGGRAASTIELQFRAAGTQNMVGAAQTVAIDSAGNFKVQAPGIGDYDLTAKPSGYLRRTIHTNVTAGDLISANFNLVVGDIVSDNVIDLSDYTKLVTYFNKLSTDGDWTTPDANGISPSNADLNGDGVVDLTDYTFIVSGFNALGDN